MVLVNNAAAVVTEDVVSGCIELVFWRYTLMDQAWWIKKIEKVKIKSDKEGVLVELLD